MQRLPIGKQTYSDIREEDMLYVDKTAYLHRMITQGSAYFLSRPRRFGKSLTLSTLAAIFSGRRDLFSGLYIDQMDYAWDVFPVIRLDMSRVPNDTPSLFKESLLLYIKGVGAAHGIALSQTHPATCFDALIAELYRQKGKVVVLVDEYDNPIIDHLLDTEVAQSNRDILRQFYTIIKASDAYVKFVLLTGVSKFAKVGVFSELNHLTDLTMDMRYAGLCGYTQVELEACFKPYIDDLAALEGAGIPETLEKIRFWYNGYRFSSVDTRVYNPYSTLLLFEQQAFKPYWFETGTPKFLVDLMQSKSYRIEEAAGVEVSEQNFSTYEIGNLNPLALLVQTGYLTIQGYEPEWRVYRLGFPNFEVEDSFLYYLLRGASKEESLADSHLRDLVHAVQCGDMTVFFETLRIFFAKIPYTIQLTDEKYYQSIFYMIFTLIGLRITAEVCTNKGRIDAVIETAERVYIFEFKLKGTARSALKQIRETGYYQRYMQAAGYPGEGHPRGGARTAVGGGGFPHARDLGDRKGASPFIFSPKTSSGQRPELVLVGVAFDPKTRNIGKWVLEPVPLALV